MPQEHTMLRSRDLVITIVLVSGFKELEQTTHTTVSYNRFQSRRNLPDYRRSQQHTQQKGNNFNISIVGKNSNVPQVAPRTTREDPTSTAISLTQFFFLSVESQELVSSETCFLFVASFLRHLLPCLHLAHHHHLHHHLLCNLHLYLQCHHLHHHLFLFWHHPLLHFHHCHHRLLSEVPPFFYPFFSLVVQSHHLPHHHPGNLIG